MSAAGGSSWEQQCLQARAELARCQQQQREMAAGQEEFLRAVAHDLRAPLRHVTSYGALVREVLGELEPAVAQGAPVQEALGFLGTMEHSARRMALMIDGLHALSQAGRVPLRLQAVALADAVAQAREVLAPSHAGRDVIWRLDPSLPTLWADPDALHTLLLQLLGNALKFTPPPAQAVITITGCTDLEGTAQWAVRDNGVGFDTARSAGLFGVFQRLHREAEFEGVGAGLALCRTIAVRHAAQISATAALQEGCTVALRWPTGASLKGAAAER